MEKTTPTKEAYDLKTATPTTIGETVVYLTEAFGDPSIGDSPLVSSLHDAMVVEIETLFEKTEYVDVDELPPKVQEYILGADLMQVFLESLSEGTKNQKIVNEHLHKINDASVSHETLTIIDQIQEQISA